MNNNLINLVIEELNEENLNLNAVGVMCHELVNRRIDNCEPRIQPVRNRNYYEHVIIRYNPDDFYSHFRMKRETFEFVLNRLQQYRVAQDIVPYEKKLLFSLWQLAKQESFLSASDRFNLSKSTAHGIFFNICSDLAALRNEFIVWPDINKKIRISNVFQRKCGITGIVGAIDGSHIEIKGPENNAIDYYNRNNYHSVVLQGVCDDKKIFTDIYVGCPGRMHDARVFRISPLQALLSNNVNPLLPNYQHLLGDSAYPLSLFLLKPYRDNGHLNEQQIRFNQRLSNARAVIEQAFGLLKGKFRRLKYLDMSRLDMVSVVISAACVLHNIILLNEGEAEDNIEEINGNIDNGGQDDLIAEGNEEAENKRNEIAAQL